MHRDWTQAEVEAGVLAVLRSFRHEPHSTRFIELKLWGMCNDEQEVSHLPDHFDVLDALHRLHASGKIRICVFHQWQLV